MKKATIFVLIVLLVAFSAMAQKKQKCTTIQSGLLTDSNGNMIMTGYDPWGYNYQAMMFNGFYDNYSRPTSPVTAGDKLMMKWNAAWLSNQDCDNDGKLDRHYGFPTYRGSGAWLTNHMTGEYELDGQIIHWTYFVKIVAVPFDATATGGIWYGADGIEIGPQIWGDFAILQEVSNDPGADVHGILYKTPVGPGLGKW